MQPVEASTVNRVIRTINRASGSSLPSLPPNPHPKPILSARLSRVASN